MLKNKYFIYILTNHSGTLYIGITRNLSKRIWEHKNKVVEGFTKRYNISKLLYYEMFEDILNAIEREKQLKNWNRKKKLALITKQNPKFREIQPQEII